MVTADATARTIQVTHPSTVDGDLARPDAAHRSAPTLRRHAANRSIAGVDADVAPRAGRRAPEERSGPHQHERHRDRYQNPRDEVR